MYWNFKSNTYTRIYDYFFNLNCLRFIPRQHHSGDKMFTYDKLIVSIKEIDFKTFDCYVNPTPRIQQWVTFHCFRRRHCLILTVSHIYIYEYFIQSYIIIYRWRSQWSLCDKSTFKRSLQRRLYINTHNIYTYLFARKQYTYIEENREIFIKKTDCEFITSTHLRPPSAQLRSVQSVCSKS